MSVKAQLADGRTLEFPDGTDPSVVQSTVKKVLGQASPNSNASADAPADTPDASGLPSHESSSHDPFTAVGETVAHMGSQAVALPAQAAASVYKLLTTPSSRSKTKAATQAAESVGNAMTYQPRSAGGKALSAVPDWVGNKIGEFGTWLGDKTVEKTGSAGLGAAAAMIPQAAGVLLGAKVPEFAAGRVAAEEANLAKRQVAHAPMDASKKEVHEAGFKLAPSEAGGPVTQTLQTMAGGPKLEKEMSGHNSGRVQDLSKLDIGLDPTHDVLDPANLERKRDEAERPYELMRTLGVVTPSNEFYNELSNVGAQFAKVDKAFPKEHGVASPDVDWSAIEAEKGRYFQPEFNADSALEAMKQLRKDSRTLLKARDDPKKLAMGLVKRQIADVFLDELDRHADAMGTPGLKEQFVAARKQLAKINTLEDAMVGDVVSGRSLAALWDNGNGVQLDGNMLKIAKAATNYKKSFQDVKPEQWKGYLSAVDYFLGVTGAAAHNPALAAAIFARCRDVWIIG